MRICSIRVALPPSQGSRRRVAAACAVQRAWRDVRQAVQTRLREYEARLRWQFQRVYGRRWQEAYARQTMLKDDDHGLNE